MVEIYDAYLAVILALYLLGVGSTLLSGITPRHGLVGASLMASVVIIHMLFQNPPADPSPKEVTPLGLVVGGWALTLFYL